MTGEECRRLFAALYFESYDLPTDLDDAEDKISRRIPCQRLLVEWKSGTKELEGRGDTHDIVKRRLTQLGYYDLADWLDKTLFDQLGKQLNKSLEFDSSLEAKLETAPKVFEDGEMKFDGKHWSKLDSVLNVALFGLVFVTLAAFGFMLKLSFRRSKVRRSSHRHADELVDLISADTEE